MEALIALEIPDRTAEVGADGIGHRETFLRVAEHEDFFVRQECGRAIREIRGVADLERLRRLVKYARRQKLHHRSEEHTSELQSLRHLVCRLLLDTETTEIYTLSLHDALPIWAIREIRGVADLERLRRLVKYARRQKLHH